MFALSYKWNWIGMLVLLVLVMGCEGENGVVSDDEVSTEDGGGAAVGVALNDADCVIIEPFEVRSGDPNLGSVAVAFGLYTCDGKGIIDLDASDIVLMEDGTAVSAAESSATLLEREAEAYITLVLDNSPSVAESGALEDTVAGASAFVDRLFQGDEATTFVRVVYFSKSFDVKQDYTNNPAIIQEAVNGLLTDATGFSTTNLYGAVQEAVSSNAAKQEARYESMNGGVMTLGQIVVFTDGSDNAGLHTLEETTAKVKATRDDVVMISLGGEVSEEALVTLGKNGSYAETDSAALQDTFEKVAEFLTSRKKAQHILGYCTPKLGGTHELTLSIAEKGASLPVEFDATGFDGEASSYCSGAGWEEACSVPQAQSCGGLWCGGCPDKAVGCGEDGRCICLDNWSGANCDVCDGGWEGEACDVCPANWTGENCDQCAGGLEGPACDVCPSNWSGVNCDECAVNWSGANCDECAVNWSGANCDVCDGGWEGLACDECPSNWSGANCDECSGNWSGANCDVCDGGWEGLACDECPSNWSGANCDECSGNWSGANCDVCDGGWEGLACDECPSNWSGANCDVCSAGYSGENCSVQPFKKITAGMFHACALTEDGSVVCWGWDGYGQSSPPEGTFTDISAGAVHTCGLRENGSVVCWGDNEYGESSPPADIFTDITGGFHFSCGLKENGTPVCWGWDLFDKTSPPNESFVSITSGSSHTCGLRFKEPGDPSGSGYNGTVICWGRNSDGESSPPSDIYFIAISAGDGHTCGLKEDGSAVCWGDNEYGQSSPPAGSFKAISAGDGHTCGLKEDGSAVCWGYNIDGQCSPPAGSFKTISAGGYHTCGLKEDGSAVCWGDIISPPE